MMTRKLLAFVVAAAVVGLIALVYWPAHSAGFVWDDKTCLHDAAWLRTGDSWKQYIWSGFCDWSNYFRPLIVALFVAEVRVFDVAPEPMHLISLALHLINTLLVGLLARMLCLQRGRTSNLLTAAAMLLYGLHPALIEPVVWISSQAELVVTLLTLLALLANTLLKHTAIRAFIVAACFLLAAGAKESAATLPLLLVLFDWMRLDTTSNTGRIAEIRQLWQRQWPVYLSVLAVGIAYLALRFGILGFLLQPTSGAPLFSLARWQTVGFVYLTYWRIIVWPMVDLGPTHEFDPGRFATFDAASAVIDLAAATIFLAGLFAAYKRKPVGYLIVAATVALLPVLHLVPVQFDPSLYHERYTMMATALVLALLPRVASTISLPAPTLRTSVIATATLGLLWLGIAVTNIRVTLPLWSDETKLWQWAAQENPASSRVKNNLLASYIKINDQVRAHALADVLLAQAHPCPECMLNVADLAIADGNLARVKTAMSKAEKAITPITPARHLQAFVLATGVMHEMEHDTDGAAEAYHDAIAMDPLDPTARISFALFLARQGKVTEARAAMDETLPLFPPDTREARREEFEQTLTAAMSAQTPLAPQKDR